MLIERKGIERTPPYLTYKETRGSYFLGPLFHYLRARGARELTVLEVGCSFGHMTEYVTEQPEVAAVTTFDTDPPFVALTRAKAAAACSAMFPMRNSSPTAPAGGTRPSGTACPSRGGTASPTSPKRRATVGASSTIPRGRARGARCCRSLPPAWRSCARPAGRRRFACRT